MTGDGGTNRLDGVVNGSILQAGTVTGTVYVGGGGRPAPPRPQQLPPFIGPFVDRRSQVAALRGLAAATARDCGVRLAVVTGRGGVGKTAVAVRALHGARDRFPAGALYADLGGYSAGGPVGADVVLGRWLHALGEPHVPAQVAEAAALLRSTTAGRPIAVLLDNVTDPGQARALLPGAGLVVVTSRDRLEDLGVDGARFITVDPLGAEAAAELIAGLARNAAAADPGAVGELVDACGRLPLALRITAARLNTRPGRSVRDAIKDLTDPHRRPHALTAGEISMTATFTASYRGLPDDGARRAFRLLSFCPGPDFAVGVAAAVLEADRAATERLLDVLAGAHLLEELGQSRYRYHDDVGDHARSLPGDDAGASRREAREATARAVDYYLRTSAAADHLLMPLRWRLSPAFLMAALHDSPFPDGVQGARHWLDREAANVVAAQAAAAEAHAYASVWPIAETMWEHFLIGHDYPLYGKILTAALHAAGKIDDPRVKARIHTLAGFYRRSAGDNPAARRHIATALELWRGAGDPFGTASAHEHMGVLERAEGHFDTALDDFTAGLRIYRRLGTERRGLALILHQIGLTHLAVGDLDAAETALQEALRIFTELPDRYNRARVLLGIGELRLRQHRPEVAMEVLDQALAIMTERGSPYSVAEVTVVIAQAHLQRGDGERARGLIDEALLIYRRHRLPHDHRRWEHLRYVADQITGS